MQHIARAVGQAHLLALLEAELLERLMFQHLPLPCTAELHACADRAIEAFVLLYRADAPSH